MFDSLIEHPTSSYCASTSMTSRYTVSMSVHRIPEPRSGRRPRIATKPYPTTSVVMNLLQDIISYFLKALVRVLCS